MGGPCQTTTTGLKWNLSESPFIVYFTDSSQTSKWCEFTRVRDGQTVFGGFVIIIVILIEVFTSPESAGFFFLNIYCVSFSKSVLLLKLLQCVDKKYIFYFIFMSLMD